MQTVATWLIRIAKELTSGVTVETQSAHSFLLRLTKASERLAPEEEDRARTVRLVANVLGLSAVSSIKYAQGGCYLCPATAFLTGLM
jgi:hypothetical protein